MNLKTYRARSMADALAEVKKDLGQDAVILHTRTFKAGGVLGFGAKTMVEVTASDGAGLPGVRPRRRAAEAAPAPSLPKVADPAAALRAYGRPNHAAATAERPAPVAAPIAPAVEAFRAIAPAVARSGADSPDSIKAAAQAALAVASENRASSVAQLDAELAAIKQMVGQVLRCSQSALMMRSSAQTGGNLPDAVFSYYLKLLESEVATEIADEVVGKVRDELSAAELSDDAIVRQTLLRHLAALIPEAGEVPRPSASGDGRPLTIALVGPTGVGKTTTVAKLAAAYKLRHGRRVGLITCDTYRIAAVDQLRTYAEIIGLPLKVAMTPTDMAAAVAALSDCEVVLIDTAGRSPRDSGRVEELRQFIDAARPHQTHLVLSGTAGQSVLLEAAQRFAPVRPDRVIFTKLDEAVNYGVLFTVARRVSLKLSYITTGQEVPDHIEVGRADRIARLLIDGSTVGGSR